MKKSDLANLTSGGIDLSQSPTSMPTNKVKDAVLGAVKEMSGANLNLIKKFAGEVNQSLSTLSHNVMLVANQNDRLEVILHNFIIIALMERTEQNAEMWDNANVTVQTFLTRNNHISQDN